jgi:hypothetical protein
MKPKRPTKERIEEVNDLCVKTYMEILGYKAILTHPSYVVFPSPFPKTEKLYVSHSTNKYFLDHGGKDGGVLDLASRLFKISKTTILMDLMPYKIDLLLDRCGDRPGPAW